MACRQGFAAQSLTMITVFGIPNCDTVKKARTWLTEHGIEHEFHDFKKQGVPEAALDRWLVVLGWERLVNRKGTTWRKLEESMREQVTDTASARALMLEQPSVIKRPVMEWEGSGPSSLTVGFDPAEWQRRI